MEQNPSVVNSIIGYGTSYMGNIESIDLLRIDGNFSGFARSYDSILIGQVGKAKGSLSAPRIIIAGVFRGQIQRTGLLIVQSTAVILGNVEVDKIIVESGAVFSATLRTVSFASFEENGNEEQRMLEQESDVGKTKQNVRIVGKLNSRMLPRLFS